MPSDRFERLCVLCIVLVAGCAKSPEAQRAAATTGSEVESAGAQDRRDEDDARENVAAEGTRGSAKLPAGLGSPADRNAAKYRTLPESDADVRDRDMREVVEGPSTARGRAADNSAQNERDRLSKPVTPLEQGNSRLDVELTASIRRALMDDEQLSFDAKNVKVVAEDGDVTLRGPVASTTEKTRVEGLARSAGANRVISLIEVEQ